MNDDASASGGMNSVFEKYLKVGSKQMSGMRFTAVNIPHGSTIFRAY